MPKPAKVGKAKTMFSNRSNATRAARKMLGKEAKPGVDFVLVKHDDGQYSFMATAPQGSKQERLISLLSRPGGITAAEAGKALGWQEHTVRGMIAGTLKAKLKLEVEAVKASHREPTVYSIKTA